MFDSIRTIPVRVRPPYDVRIGSGLLGRCGDYLAALLGQRRIAVLADDTVASLYLDTVTAALEDAGFAVCSHIFPSGEGRKNLSTLTELLEFLASEHLTRTDCVAALGGGVTVAGLNRNSLQGDRAICTLLSAMGAGTAWSGSSCTAAPGPLQPLQVDARSIPDLVPILAVTASAAPGITRVEHAGRLRLKESDRLEALCRLLQDLGGSAFLEGDCLVVQGGTPLTGGAVMSYGDHRIAMAAAVAASLCTGPVRLIGAEAVTKSYPRFWQDYQSLGGIWEEIS